MNDEDLARLSVDVDLLMENMAALSKMHQRLRELLGQRARQFMTPDIPDDGRGRWRASWHRHLESMEVVVGSTQNLFNHDGPGREFARFHLDLLVSSVCRWDGKNLLSADKDSYTHFFLYDPLKFVLVPKELALRILALGYAP
jgi:hypothetical protein